MNRRVANGHRLRKTNNGSPHMPTHVPRTPKTSASTSASAPASTSASTISTFFDGAIARFFRRQQRPLPRPPRKYPGIPIPASIDKATAVNAAAWGTGASSVLLLAMVAVGVASSARKKKRMKLAGEKRRRRKTKSADVGDRVPHAHKGSSVNRVVAAADTDNGERVVAALEDPLVAVHSDIRNDSGGGGDDGDGSGDDSIIEIIRESKPSSHLQPLWQQQQKIPNFDRAMAQATAHTRASLEQSVLALSRRLAAAGRPADLRSTLLFLAEEGIPAFLEASVADARRRVQGAEGLRSSAEDLTAYYAQRLPPDSLPTSPNPANTIKLAIESAQTAGERAGLESEFDVIEARAAVADAWADLDHAVARHSSDSHSPPAQIKQLPPPLPLPLPQQQPSATTVKIPAAPAAPGIEQKQIILQKNKARLRRLERRRTRTFAKLSDSDLEIVTKKKNSLGLQITRRAVGEAYRSLWAERKRLRGLEDALRISKTLAFKQALSTLTNNQLGEVLLGTVASASVGLRHVPPSDDDIFVITPREHGDSELDLALPLEPQPSPEPSALISRKNSDSGGTNIITRMFQNLTIGSPQTKGTESTENPRLRSSTQPPALEYYNNSHPNSQRSDSVQPESAPEYWDHPEVQAAMAAMDLLLQPQTSDTTMVENDHTTPGNPNSAALVLTVSKNTTASPAMRSQPTWQSWFMAFAGFQDSSPARTRPETKYSPDLLDMVAKIKTDTIFDQEGRWEGVVSFVKRQVSGLGDESGAETLLQYPLFNSLLDAGDLSEFFTTPIRGIRQDQKSRWDQVRAFFPELGRIQAIVEQEGVEMIEGGQATVRSTVWDFVAACEDAIRWYATSATAWINADEDEMDFNTWVKSRAVPALAMGSTNTEQDFACVLHVIGCFFDGAWVSVPSGSPKHKLYENRKAIWGYMTQGEPWSYDISDIYKDKAAQSTYYTLLRAFLVHGSDERIRGFFADTPMCSFMTQEEKQSVDNQLSPSLRELVA